MAEVFMGVFRNLVEKVGLGGNAKSISSVDELADFIDRRASFLAQHCVVEFCRVRAGVYWQKLFEEKDFQEKLGESCWESFAPAMAMVLEMTDAHLRPAAGLRRHELPKRLSALGHEICARYPLPRHAQADFPDRQRALINQEMARAERDAARPVREMAAPMARLIYDRLPIHKDIVRHDYDYIFNHLRMNLLRAHEDFERQAVPKALFEALLEGHD
jgi:hypothetical protein